jgi:hypothetical protein
MKYQKPEVTLLTSALSAIQSTDPCAKGDILVDENSGCPVNHATVGAYQADE